MDSETSGSQSNHCSSPQKAPLRAPLRLDVLIPPRRSLRRWVRTSSTTLGATGTPSWMCDRMTRCTRHGTHKHTATGSERRTWSIWGAFRSKLKSLLSFLCVGAHSMSIFGAEGACSLPLPISWQKTTLLVTSHESSISPQSGSIRIYRDACVALFISTCIVGKNWLSMLELYFIARSATSASVFRRIGPLASNASTLPLSPRTLSRTTSPVQTLHQALQPTSNGNGLQPQKTKKRWLFHPLASRMCL